MTLTIDRADLRRMDGWANRSGVVARRVLVVLLAGAFIGCMAASSPSEGKPGPCPAGMAHVAIEGLRAYCIDRWEAQVVEVRGKEEVAHPPTQPVTLTRIPDERPDAEPLPKDREPVPVLDFDTVRVGEEATFRLQPESRKSKPVSRITTTVVELVHIAAAGDRIG